MDVKLKAGELLDGTVIRSTGSWYDVSTAGGTVASKIRGKFRLEGREETNPIAVGDRVTIRINEDGTGLITEIHERENRLVRRAAGRRVGREHVIVANVDMVWVVQSVDLPPPNPGFIDRILVVAARNELDAGILFNKSDLIEDVRSPFIEELTELYESLDYPVRIVSAESESGIADLRGEFEEQTTVLVGPSGTGKSTLLNAIEPGLGARTAEISERTRKGRHTTTNVTLYPLSFGGYAVDTPGVREFGVLDFEPGDLAHYFVEFVPHIHDCRFPNCTHDHEPGCAIIDAFERGEISDLRYRNYLSILDSLRLGERDIGR